VDAQVREDLERTASRQRWVAKTRNYFIRLQGVVTHMCREDEGGLGKTITVGSKLHHQPREDKRSIRADDVCKLLKGGLGSGTNGAKSREKKPRSRKKGDVLLVDPTPMVGKCASARWVSCEGNARWEGVS